MYKRLKYVFVTIVIGFCLNEDAGLICWIRDKDLIVVMEFYIFCNFSFLVYVYIQYYVQLIYIITAFSTGWWYIFAQLFIILIWTILILEKDLKRPRYNFYYADNLCAHGLSQPYEIQNKFVILYTFPSFLPYIMNKIIILCNLTWWI